MVQPAPLRSPRFQGWACQESGTRAGLGKQLPSQVTFSQHAAPVAPDKKHKPHMQAQPHAGSRTGTQAAAPQPRGSQLGARRHGEGSATPGLHRGYSQEQGRLGQEELQGMGNRGGR